MRNCVTQRRQSELSAWTNWKEEAMTRREKEEDQQKRKMKRRKKRATSMKRDERENEGRAVTDD